MKTVELKTKSDFQTMHEWVLYGLKNGVNFGREEYKYIFEKMQKRPLVAKYESVRLATTMLLDNLNDSDVEAVIDLLNNYFKIKAKHVIVNQPYIDINSEIHNEYKKVFKHFTCKCLKPRAALAIVLLADAFNKKTKEM